MKHRTVSLYDTTLRDGNQGLGVHLSLSDKLRITEKLDEIGIHYIEGGWPNPTNTIDTEYYRSVKKLRIKAKIAAFGSTRRPGIKVSADPFVAMVASSGTPAITVYGKSWDLHVERVLCTSLQENLAMISDTVAYLKKHTDEVIYDAEHFFDGYRANPEYALKTLDAARDAGAGCLVLCDTNGGLLPDEFLTIFRYVRARFKGRIGVHMHNDTGCADALSCLGVLEGADQVQGTMNGMGERCGNANLCTIIPNLQLKRDIPLVAERQLRMLTPAAVFIAEIANTIPDMAQPYVGEAAFAHKAGAHADAVRKVRASFEHVQPETVGNARHFVLSHQAGSGTMLEKLKAVLPGIDKKDPRVKKLLQHIKEQESAGYQYEAAEGSFDLLARKKLGHFTEPFEVLGFRVIEEKRENGNVFSEATIKVREDDIIEHTAAEGDGPVNALDNALRKALTKFYPSLAKVKLEDFKVRVLDGREGTEAKVRVLIESSDGESRWATVGVSTNIIEASWLALIDSLKYKLMMEQHQKG
ncbi:MAG: citramalate synthase [Chitinispirillaceae bacterium]|nr:citramalate synthase [Chitinispirillaceae bacterium]